MDDNKPRLIGRKEAAAYCGVSEATFSNWVAGHIMPPTIPGTRKWDRRAIDARLDEISGLQPAKEEDPYDKWMRENVEGYQPTITTGETDLQKWRKKQKKKEKYRPQLRLDAKLERVLLFMNDHPDCTTADVIPGAGTALLEKLASTGAIHIKKADGRLSYTVSDEGRAEAERVVNWRLSR